MHDVELLRGEYLQVDVMDDTYEQALAQAMERLSALVLDPVSLDWDDEGGDSMAQHAAGLGGRGWVVHSTSGQVSPGGQQLALSVVFRRQ